jgi:hypothetical protein
LDVTNPAFAETTAPVPTVADLIELHSDYGKDIEVNDADGRIYTQETCRCGMPLGMHLSLETHRAQALEDYLADQVAESFLAVRGQLQRVADELALHDAPLHIQATLDQVIVENSIRLHLPLPDVAEKVETLRAAAAGAGLPHAVDFFNHDGSANVVWQQPTRRVTVYIAHGTPYELEDVPFGPTIPFSSDDPAAVAAKVAELLSGEDA